MKKLIALFLLPLSLLAQPTNYSSMTNMVIATGAANSDAALSLTNGHTALVPFGLIWSLGTNTAALLAADQAKKATNSLGTAAFTASTAYDAAGAASSAISGLPKGVTASGSATATTNGSGVVDIAVSASGGGDVLAAGNTHFTGNNQFSGSNNYTGTLVVEGAFRVDDGSLIATNQLAITNGAGSYALRTFGPIQIDGVQGATTADVVNSTNTARLAINLANSFDASGAATTDSQNATNTARLAVNLAGSFLGLHATADAATAYTGSLTLAQVSNSIPAIITNAITGQKLVNTNAINTGVFVFGQDWTTNISGNIALGAFGGVDTTHDQFMMITAKPSGADRTVTMPTGVHCVGAELTSAGVFTATNNMTLKVLVENNAGQQTNAYSRTVP